MGDTLENADVKEEELDKLSEEELDEMLDELEDDELTDLNREERRKERRKNRKIRKINRKRKIKELKIKIENILKDPVKREKLIEVMKNILYISSGGRIDYRS